MISAIKNRLNGGVPPQPPIPNGSTKNGIQCDGQDGGLRPPSTENFGRRSPRIRKRAIDQAPYQESVAARELRIFYNRNKLCNSFKKVLSSSAGLFIVLILYMCLGAILFQNLEQEREETERKQLRKNREDVTDNIINCYHNQTVDLETCIGLQMESWERVVVKSYQASVSYETTWTFLNSFYFCFTTISTVGYGTITPHTLLGRFICVFYAIVGIPLMLLFIADVGTALARWAKICAIAIKQRRKKGRTFKEAAKASLRKHLKPLKNSSPPEGEGSPAVIEGNKRTSPSPVPVDDVRSPSPSNEDNVYVPGEFWVKMHVPKTRSLSMTTQHSHSFDEQDDPTDDNSGENDDDESSDSDDSGSGSSGEDSREKEGSAETLKMAECSSIVVQIDPDSDTDLYKSTDDEQGCFDQNGNRTEIVRHLQSEDSLESPTEVLVNPGASLDSPVEQVDQPAQTVSDSVGAADSKSGALSSMKKQTSRVNFSDVIDLQSGKRTSLDELKEPRNTSTDDEPPKMAGGIIENPLVRESEEDETEADKLLKPTGFRFSAAPRRNAVFIPGSDTSPSDPPTSPDMRGGQGGESSSRRRSSITRRMGMAFGSITAVSDREVAHFSFPAWLALLLLIIYIVFGAGIVSMSEGWGFIDSFYFSFVSLSTIGFGDITPVNSEEFTFMYTFLGLCFTSMCMSLSSKELTRLLKKLAWKVGYYKSRQWKGSVRAFVKDKKRRIHERSEHWRGSRRQKSRRRKRPSAARRSGDRSSMKSMSSPSLERAQNHIGAERVT